MLDKTDLQILLVLLDAKDPLTSQQIATSISKSSRTIRERIKRIEDEISMNGATIISRPGVGISLRIHNDDLFSEILQRYPWLEEDMEQRLEQDQKALILMMLSYDGYIKSQELCHHLTISRSKLSSLLMELRKILRNYDLEIETKPHYGMKIMGSELDMRRFISSYYVQDNWFVDEVDCNVYSSFDEYTMIEQDITALHVIRSLVQREINTVDYAMPTTVFKSLCIHLFITIKRLQEGNTLIEMNSLSMQDTQRVEVDLANRIINKLEAYFNVKFSEYEMIHITMHFLSKRVLKEDQKRTVPPEINKLVEDILHDIQQQKKLDLSDDFDLRMMLGLHLVPLISRLEYDIVLKNPILDEVKAKCVASYDLAIVAAKRIKEDLYYDLSEHELSYLAIHFDVAMIKKQKQTLKKRVLIICASGRASAELLRIQFEQQFQAHLASIDVCDITEAQDYLNTMKFDYIFSTIHLPASIISPLPVFEFSFFLDHSSIKRIESVLSYRNGWEEYFKPTLFFSHLYIENKVQVIDFMIKQARKQYQLPDDFDQLVFEREAFSGTDILDQIALPHPAQVVSETTFVVIAILDKPILWEKRWVQVVFLVSVSRYDSERYKSLMEKIVQVACSKKALDRIIRKQTFETLIEAIGNE